MSKIDYFSFFLMFCVLEEGWEGWITYLDVWNAGS